MLLDWIWKLAATKAKNPHAMFWPWMASFVCTSVDFYFDFLRCGCEREAPVVGVEQTKDWISVIFEQKYYKCFFFSIICQLQYSIYNISFCKTHSIGDSLLFLLVKKYFSCVKNVTSSRWLEWSVMHLGLCSSSSSTSSFGSQNCFTHSTILILTLSLTPLSKSCPWKVIILRFLAALSVPTNAS